MPKELSEFYKAVSNKDGYSNTCKTCKRIDYRAYGKSKSKDYHKDKRLRARDRNRENILEYLRDLECNHCGITDDCWSIYDFHHINPSTKDKNIGNLMTNSWSKLKLEIDKCILLCANCHRKVHNDT